MAETWYVVEGEVGLSEDQIRAYPAGPVLDVLVARRVFGMAVDVEEAWAYAERWWQTQPSCVWFHMHTPPFAAVRGQRESFEWRLPPYSTDILAAWQILAQLGEHKFQLWNEHGLWDCTFDGGPEALDCETAPLAIARAALLACKTSRA